MIFTQLKFFVFFFIVLAVYYLIHPGIRYIWLLLTSLYFYALNGPEFLICLLFVTAVTWVGGKFIQPEEPRRNKWIVAACAVLSFSVLFAYKYLKFFALTGNKLFEMLDFGWELPLPELMAPLGISFFTFQAMSYVIDRYRGDVEQEKDPLRYLLFVCFFPTILSGPIQKAKDRLASFSASAQEGKSNIDSISFDWDRVRGGLILALWGCFIKLVIGDRLGVFVNTVYDGETVYQGFVVMVASVFYTIQIYCDFAGYSYMAIGIAKALGFELGDNFRQPYLAVSIKDFWRRWHISLSTWFRDYLYIPLGGNRRGSLRRRLNLMITFVVSGLWHGAGWNFVIWGALHGFYQVAGELLAPLRMKACKLLRIKSETEAFHLLRVGTVFALTSFAWIFFRASDLTAALTLLKNMLVFNPWVLVDGTLFTVGLDSKDFVLLLICLIIVFCVDKANERVPMLVKLEEQNLVFRWCVYFLLIFSVLIFGMYGPAYDASAFIYFQF